MRRFAFVLRRLFLLAFVLPAVSLLAFTISRVIPGDPIALIAGPTAKPETRAALREAWGLDEPIPVQYWLYLTRLVRGDLGLSMHTGRSVTTDLIEFFPATVELATAALCLGLPFAVAGGVIAAVRKDSLVDYLIRGIISFGISVPVFWFGILLILVFSAQLGLFPSVGRLPVTTAIPPRVTGMYTVDALFAGDFAALRAALLHLTLPAVALAVTVVAPVARITRTNMLSVLRQDYVRTARAKGVPERLVIYRHALRNAFLPIITSIGLVYGLLLAGAVVTESVFSWPGIGFYVTKSILSLDFQPVVSFTLASALLYVIINLLVDLAYAFIDPRVELA